MARIRIRPTTPPPTHDNGSLAFQPTPLDGDCGVSSLDYYFRETELGRQTGTVNYLSASTLKNL